MTSRESVLFDIIKTLSQVNQNLLDVLQRNCQSINHFDQFLVLGSANMVTIAGVDMDYFIEQDTLQSEAEELVICVN